MAPRRHRVAGARADRNGGSWRQRESIGTRANGATSSSRRFVVRRAE
jgi:hypothetical protein